MLLNKKELVTKLRDEGLSFRETGEALGMSSGMAYRIYTGRSYYKRKKFPLTEKLDKETFERILSESDTKREVIEKLRNLGLSFGEIGALLGISRQAAWISLNPTPYSELSDSVKRSISERNKLKRLGVRELIKSDPELAKSYGIDLRRYGV